MNIKTKLDGFILRHAVREDAPLILSFIKALAEYERLSHEVIATEDKLISSLFDQPAAEVIIGEYEGQPMAFALFFTTYSTFLASPGIHLEDLYVDPKMRGKGIGSILLSYLAGLVKERNYSRLEWACLDWNEPSIQFYRSMGAIPMDDWTTYRVCDQSIDTLAARFMQ